MKDTRIFILRSPDLYTLQRKMQRLMMQNNIQIRSTIANVHKNPIITLLSGHIVRYSLITVLCIPFSFKNSDKDCLVQVQWTTAHENLEEVVLKVLNLRRYSDFGPIANNRFQVFRQSIFSVFGLEICAIMSSICSSQTPHSLLSCLVSCTVVKASL